MEEITTEGKEAEDVQQLTVDVDVVVTGAEVDERTGFKGETGIPREGAEQELVRAGKRRLDITDPVDTAGEVDDGGARDGTDKEGDD